MIVKKYRVVIVEIKGIVDARSLFEFEKEYDTEEEASNAIATVLNKYIPESYTFAILPIYYKMKEN
jgi:type III secretory pathway lipoprotein EscJ